MKKMVVIGLSTLGISACSPYAGNADEKYLASRNGASVIAPSPLTNANISRFYDLPNPEKNAIVNIMPMPLSPQGKVNEPG